MKISVLKASSNFAVWAGAFVLGAILTTLAALRIYFPVTNDQIDFALKWNVVFFKIVPVAFLFGGLLLSFSTLLLQRKSPKFAWCISGLGYLLACAVGVMVWLYRIKAIPD